MYTKSPLTLVTAYYQLSKSKYTPKHYVQWIKNFLSNAPGPICIYTHAEQMDFMAKLRKGYENSTYLVEREFNQLQTYPYFMLSDEQHALDVHRNLHPSSEIYVVWNAKPAFVHEAYKENPFQSDWFMWVDIGMFRDARFSSIPMKLVKHWPCFERIDTLLPKDKMTIALAEKPAYRKNLHIDADVTPTVACKYISTCGGVLILPVSILPKIYTLYYELLEQNVRKKTFCGHDQNNLSQLVYLYPEYCNLLQSLPHFPSPWMYIQHYLSTTERLLW